MTRALILVGDEAWTPEEWEAEQRRRERDAERTKAKREVHNAYQRAYRAKNLDRMRAYHREWMMRYRRGKGVEPMSYRVGALHSLGCTGPHAKPRKNCVPIPMWTRRSEAA